MPEFEARPIGRDDHVDQRERSRVGIRPVHHAVARLLAWGCKIRVAARMTGYSESGVRGMLERPEFQALLRRYQGQVNLSGLDLKERIQLGAQEALARLHELVREEDVQPEVLLRATTDLLDRSGFRPVRSREVR
ncbi:MAG: hypothetical protein JSW65_04305, partial [Candidatus Bipolaricaulota bacterium]